MPVLGHAFVGLAIGLTTHPVHAYGEASLPPRLGETAKTGGERRAIVTYGDVLWLPLMVGLSYLPDLAAQLAQPIGWRNARLVTHAVVFAGVVSLFLVPLLTSMAMMSFPRAYAISFLSVLLHDVLDLLAATNRAPLWPFSSRLVCVDVAIIPTSLLPEATFFGGLFVIFLVVWQLIGHTRFAEPLGHKGVFNVLYGMRWRSISLVAVIMLAAAITHQLRDRREAELEQARTMAHKQRAYQGALDMLQEAERWPSTANPGRIDYLRAWTYEQLGDRRRAEELYLRSYSADPMYFWTVADLALFYSFSDGSIEVREGLARTYLKHLQRDFPGHPELVAVLSSAEEALARPGSLTHKDLQSLSDRQREE